MTFKKIDFKSLIKPRLSEIFEKETGVWVQVDTIKPLFADINEYLIQLSKTMEVVGEEIVDLREAMEDFEKKAIKKIEEDEHVLLRNLKDGVADIIHEDKREYEDDIDKIKGEIRDKIEALISELRQKVDDKIEDYMRDHLVRYDGLKSDLEKQRSAIKKLIEGLTER